MFPTLLNLNQLPRMTTIAADGDLELRRLYKVLKKGDASEVFLGTNSQIITGTIVAKMKVSRQVLVDNTGVGKVSLAATGTNLFRLLSTWRLHPCQPSRLFIALSMTLLMTRPRLSRPKMSGRLYNNVVNVISSFNMSGQGVVLEVDRCAEHSGKRLRVG